MAKIKLLRLQTANGCGPYNADVNWIAHIKDAPDWGNYDSQYSPQNKLRHPTPNTDSKMKDAWLQLQDAGEHCNYHFGFTNLEQLRSWFYRDEWIRSMADKEIMVTEWEVEKEDVIIGNAQLIFNRSKATKINTYPVINLIQSIQSN